LDMMFSYYDTSIGIDGQGNTKDFLSPRA